MSKPYSEADHEILKNLFCKHGDPQKIRKFHYWQDVCKEFNAQTENVKRVPLQIRSYYQNRRRGLRRFLFKPKKAVFVSYSRQRENENMPWPLPEANKKILDKVLETHKKPDMDRGEACSYYKTVSKEYNRLANGFRKTPKQVRTYVYNIKRRETRRRHKKERQEKSPDVVESPESPAVALTAIPEDIVCKNIRSLGSTSRKASTPSSSGHLVSSTEQPNSSSSGSVGLSREQPNSVSNIYMASSREQPNTSSSGYMGSSRERQNSSPSGYMGSSREQPNSSSSGYMGSSTGQPNEEFRSLADDLPKSWEYTEIGSDFLSSPLHQATSQGQAEPEEPHIFDDVDDYSIGRGSYAEKNGMSQDLVNILTDQARQHHKLKMKMLKEQYNRMTEVYKTKMFMLEAELEMKRKQHEQKMGNLIQEYKRIKDNLDG